MTNATAHRRAMWRAVRAYVSDEGHERNMDKLSYLLTDPEWYQLLQWIDVASSVLAEKPANPIPIIKKRIGYAS